MFGNMFSTTYQKLSDSWAMCGAGQTVEHLKQRARKSRDQETAKSKAATWGPTHSIDSEEERKTEWWSPSFIKDAWTTPPELNRSPGTNSTKSSDSSPRAAAPPTTTSTPETTPSQQQQQQHHSWTSWPYCRQDTTVESREELPRQSLMEMVEDACSPCHPRKLSQLEQRAEPSLGISPMVPPGGSGSANSMQSVHSIPASSSGSVRTTETAADRRRQRHAKRQQQHQQQEQQLQQQQQQQAQQPQAPPPTQQPQPARKSSSSSVAPSLSPHEDVEATPTQVLSVVPETQTIGNSAAPDMAKIAPLDTFTVDRSTIVELERSISELTMRSSYGVATAKLSENRRMAYYAVGKHHRQSGRGGNRRCYFTGKLILSGAPFYAGSVQQGLRTLVVFCLPSSLGLPKGSEASKDAASVIMSLEGGSVSKLTKSPSKRSILSRGKGSVLPSSKMSYLDEMSLSVGEELDPNWGLDKDYLLRVLPDPNQGIMDEMARRFPEQFETLPVQVRAPECWRLYVKFCFFSGLPIAEGELHYKVIDEVADIFGEEVILSHDVMEAVNGPESAEILRLPNLKTFRYLRKHYSQQSAKLPEEVFQRKAWEIMLPEV